MFAGKSFKNGSKVKKKVLHSPEKNLERMILNQPSRTSKKAGASTTKPFRATTVALSNICNIRKQGWIMSEWVPSQDSALMVSS
jgi:hypothetical protein